MRKLTFLLALLALLIAGTVGAYRVIEVPEAVARTTVVVVGGGVAAPAAGPVAIVGTPTEYAQNPGGASDPTEFEYTVESASYRALVVIAVSNTDQTGTTVTYNGDAMTRVVQYNNGSWTYLGIFVLANPDSGGAYTVSVNWGNNAPQYGDYCVAMTAENVNQSTPASDAVQDKNTGSSSTVAVANMTSNDLAIAAVSVDTSNNDVSATTGTLLAKSDGSTNWATGGVARNAGTGNVSIAFSHTSATYAIAGIRLNAN